jgi:sortase A
MQLSSVSTETEDIVIESSLSKEDVIDEFIESVDDKTLVYDEVFNNLNYESILVIEKLDFIQPVIEHATVAHLNLSVSSLTSNHKPWTDGNYAIAGHRSLTDGLHFNSLDQLEVGDKVIVVDENLVKYTYLLEEKMIVHKSDLTSLESTRQRQITLITCDPFGEKNPENRLILKGRLLETTESK